MIRDTGLLEVPLWAAEELELTGTRPDGDSYQAYQTCANGLARIPRYYKAGWRAWLRKTGPAKPMASAITLRPAQVEPAAEALSVLRTDRGCFYSDRCGGGKTVVALDLRAKLGARKTIVLVDQTNLLEQWAVRVHEHVGLDEEVGIWSSRAGFLSVVRYAKKVGIVGKLVHLRRRKDVRKHNGIVIVMAQRLYRKTPPEKPIACDMLVADEAHVFSAPKFMSAVFWFDFTYSLALSANKKRKDKMEWIFKSFLGAKIVNGTGGGRTKATVVVDSFTVPGIRDMEKYGSLFCRRWRIGGKTRALKVCERICQAGTLTRTRDGQTETLFVDGCPFYKKFPNCGGLADTHIDPKDLTRGRIDAWALLDDVYGSKTYRRHVLYWVNKLFEADRQVLVFCQTVVFAELVHAWATAKFGADRVGLYLRNARGDKAAVELAKSITVVTQSKAAKGLDVPHKDSIVWALSSGDFPQIIGRIERTREGKATPVAVLLRPKNAYAWAGRIHREQTMWLRKNKYEVRNANVTKHLDRRVPRRSTR